MQQGCDEILHRCTACRRDCPGWRRADQLVPPVAVEVCTVSLLPVLRDRPSFLSTERGTRAETTFCSTDSITSLDGVDENQSHVQRLQSQAVCGFTIVFS